MEEDVVHFGDLARVGARRCADHYNWTAFDISPGDRVESYERADPVLQRYRPKAAGASVGVGSVRCVELVDRSDRSHAVEVLERLRKVLYVVAWYLKDLGDFEL